MWHQDNEATFQEDGFDSFDAAGVGVVPILKTKIGNWTPDDEASNFQFSPLALGFADHLPISPAICADAE